MASGDQSRGDEPGVRGCALCGLYYDRGCLACPVMKHTGEVECCCTPYLEAHREWLKHGTASEQFKKAAAEELAFLRSLLPAEEA